jgi:ribosomal protein S27AE
MDSELKACPFCGSTDVRRDHPNRAPRVYCGECRVVTDSPEHWNTRAPDAKAEAVDAEKVWRQAYAAFDIAKSHMASGPSNPPAAATAVIAAAIRAAKEQS